MEGYEKIHGVNAWDRVKANIESCVKLKELHGYKCTIGLQMVLVPQCADQIISEAQFAIESGVDYMVVKQFSDPGDDRMVQFELDWYDNPSIQEELKKAEAMSTDRTKIVPKWQTIKRKGKREYDHCVDCALLFQVSGNSKCYPCGHLFNREEYCYGDLIVTGKQ